MKPILVLDGETDQALAVIRALSDAGLHVHVGCSRRTGPGYWSFRAERRFLYPSPVHEPERFVSSLRAFLSRESYEAVFPVTDSTITILQRFRHELPSVPFAMASPESYQKVSDKFLMQRLAASHSLSLPETHYPKSEKELGELAREVEYPVVVKPRYSRFYDEEKKKLLIGDSRTVFDSKELERLSLALRQGQDLPCIQKWVEGRGFGVELLIQRGKPLALFSHERIREMNPLGSGSSACRSVPVREELVKASLSLLGECNFEGVAMAEFRVDSKTEEAWFMEINGRFWGTLALAVACGINFPYLYLQAFVRGEEVNAFDGKYREGVEARSLWKESERLISALKGKPAAWQGPFPTRGEALGDYFGSFLKPGQIYCDMELKDPFPGIMATLSVLLRK